MWKMSFEQFIKMAKRGYLLDSPTFDPSDLDHVAQYQQPDPTTGELLVMNLPPLPIRPIRSTGMVPYCLASTQTALSATALACVVTQIQPLLDSGRIY